MTAQTDALIATLREIVAAAPIRRNKYSTWAKVPWSLIDKARKQFTAMGIDWRVNQNTREGD